MPRSCEAWKKAVVSLFGSSPNMSRLQSEERKVFLWWWQHNFKWILQDQTFLLLRKTEEKIVYFWVYMLGSPNEAKHFSYTLKLFGRKTTLTIEGEVAAIDESFDTLSEAEKCFAYAHKMFVAQFSDEDRNCIIQKWYIFVHFCNLPSSL